MVFSLDFPYVLGQPQQTVDFRQKPEDFIVEEKLGFEPSGEGEHIFIHLQKTGENTGYVAEKLAQFFNVKPMDVGYSGMKDRHAITTQWFSVYAPKTCAPKIGKDFDWEQFATISQVNVKILSVSRNLKKLRRGEHKSNGFSITLKNCQNIKEIEQRINLIIRHGVPNYFGEQRFGRDAHNLHLAALWFEKGELIRKRKLRGLVMSAARSYLFNLIVAQRVKEKCWNKSLLGEPEGFAQGSAPLWGRGRTSAQSDVKLLEDSILNDFPLWLEGLEHCGLDQSRRSSLLMPKKLTFKSSGAEITIDFELESGQFATSVLREIAQLNNLANPFTQHKDVVADK